MKVLLTGAAGQLGQALMAACPPGVALIPCSRSGGPGQMALDLADPAACRSLVLEQRPDAVLNAGAYTAVDRAEQEPALAQAVNADAPAAFAEALATTGGQLLQVSTDFVFNGRQGSPYAPDQTVDPLGVYGASKAAGELAAEPLCPYPPGIPLLIPGERIDGPRAAWLQEQRALWPGQIADTVSVVAR